MQIVENGEQQYSHAYDLVEGMRKDVGEEVDKTKFPMCLMSERVMSWPIGHLHSTSRGLGGQI